MVMLVMLTRNSFGFGQFLSWHLMLCLNFFYLKVCWLNCFIHQHSVDIYNILDHFKLEFKLLHLVLDWYHLVLDSELELKWPSLFWCAATLKVTVVNRANSTVTCCCVLVFCMWWLNCDTICPSEPTDMSAIWECAHYYRIKIKHIQLHMTRYVIRLPPVTQASCITNALKSACLTVLSVFPLSELMVVLRNLTSLHMHYEL